MNNCSLDLDYKKIQASVNDKTISAEQKGEEKVKSSSFGASHSSSFSSTSPDPEIQTLLASPIVQSIMHILKTDQRCNGNDALLIMKVCEKLGLCRCLRDSRGYRGFIFYEKDILSDRIHAGTLETIRRYRQKVLQHNLLNLTNEYGELIEG